MTYKKPLCPYSPRTPYPRGIASSWLDIWFQDAHATFSLLPRSYPMDPRAYPM